MAAIVINLPYSAYFAPDPVLKKLDLSEEDWQLENWRLVDPWLAAIVAQAANFERRGHKYEYPVISYQYSPLVADPWGLVADELNAGLEPGGSPYFIQRGSKGQSFIFSRKDQEIILERTVRPFHRQIEETVNECLTQSPLVLVLTIRSFSSTPFNFEADRRYPRPQASIGASEQHTPAGLSNLAGWCFKSFNWWVELNWPQSGAMLPPALVGHPRVKALGLAFSRALYLDEKTGREKKSAVQVARVLSTTFNILDQELRYVSAKRLERAANTRKKQPKIPSPVIKAEKPPK